MAVRVLVVDDSAYHRRTLGRVIAADPGLELAGTAADGEEAIKKVVALRPDVVTLDLEMPRMDGFTFLRWLMRALPRPVLVVSSRESNKSVFRALDLGAADFVVKPVHYASERLGEIGETVVAKIHEIAAARLDRLADRAARQTAVPVPARPAPRPPGVAKPAVRPAAPGRVRCVAIGASTGGPPALQQVLGGLPAELPAGVVIAQHMPEGFTRMFAERLDRLVGLRVREAEGGEPVEPGQVLLAPGGRHLAVRRDAEGRAVAVLVAPRPGDRYVPSVDVLLETAAETFGAGLLTAVLTGMGDDGAAGTRAAKGRGAVTLAEAEETSVVFGMPREAIRTGSVDRVLPLGEISGAIARECLAPRAEEAR